MEYVYKINIFGLIMTVKSGVEKLFLKSLYAQNLFITQKRRTFAKNDKFSKKNDLPCNFQNIYLWCTYELMIWTTHFMKMLMKNWGTDMCDIPHLKAFVRINFQYFQEFATKSKIESQWQFLVYEWFEFSRIRCHLKLWSKIFSNIPFWARK